MQASRSRPSRQAARLCTQASAPGPGRAGDTWAACRWGRVLPPCLLQQQAGYPAAARGGALPGVHGVDPAASGRGRRRLCRGHPEALRYPTPQVRAGAHARAGWGAAERAF